MLSIIISSYQQDNYISIERNIAETIGVGIIYEVIQINNPGTMSLCKAYNRGLDQSKYPYILFVHEDLVFNSFGWGNTLLEIIESDEKIGLVGVAGGKYKTQAPSAWWDIADSDKFMYVRHGNNSENELLQYGFDNPLSERIVKVLSVDGLFIGMKKTTGLRFNESLKGYHQYDLGISIDAYLQGYKTVCTDLIDITHYSMGNIDKTWIESADKFFKQYAQYLPLGVNISLTESEVAELERKNYMHFIALAWKAGLKQIAKEYWLRFIRKESFSDDAFHFWRELTS